MDVRTALERLPKVELHCHVEATMRPGTVVELADRHAIQLPTRDPTELGLVYRETLFTPARHLDAGQDPTDMVAGLAGCGRGRRRSAPG